MKSNIELQKEVQEELKWEPTLSDANVNVSTQNGVVILSGVVNSLLKKQSAMRYAKNVKNVKSVKSNIKVSARISVSLSKSKINVAEDNFSNSGENALKISGA